MQGRPAESGPLRRPDGRLVDVATRRLDDAAVPALELGRGCLPRLAAHPAPPSAWYAAAPPPPASSPWRRRVHHTRAADRAFVDRAAERIEHEVPGADVLHLAATEPRLEMRDPAGREAPQVIARGALLARAPDGLPLEQVVRPCIAARLGHPAVRLHDARAGPHEEEGRDGLAVGRLGEQEPRPAGRAIGIPHVAIGLFGPDEEPCPVGGLAVDPVELAQPVTLGVHDRDPRRSGLVDVLPPFLAQVAPQRIFVRTEVDDPRRCRLDGRRRAPAGVAQGPTQASVRVGRAVPFDLGVDPQVGYPAATRPQRRAGGLGECVDRLGRPRACHRTAWRIGEAPRHGRGRRTRTCAPITGSPPASSWTMRLAAHPLTAFTSAQPASCRYEPGSLDSTNPSQSRAASGAVTTGAGGGARRP